MNRPSLPASHVPEDITLKAERLRLVVFAEPKIGKTTLAMTFPRPLVIDTDGGLVSVTVKRPGEQLGKSWTPTGHQDLEGLARWITEHLDDHDTIIVDSGPELVFTLMDELIEDGAEYDARKNKDVHPVARWVAEQAEYGASQRQMHKFLRFLRLTGKHIVITSGVRVDDFGKRTADFSPGLLKVVAHWASVLGELDKADDGTRVLMTDPTNKRQAGTRFSELSPAVINPTFGTLWGPVEASLRSGDAKQGASTPGKE